MGKSLQVGKARERNLKDFIRHSFFLTGYDKDCRIFLTLKCLRRIPFPCLEAKLAAHGIWVVFAMYMCRH